MRRVLRFLKEAVVVIGLGLFLAVSGLIWLVRKALFKLKIAKDPGKLDDMFAM